MQDITILMTPMVKVNMGLLEKLTFYKDLSVILHSSLNFVRHIDEIVNRANKMLGFIGRQSVGFSEFLCSLFHRSFVPFKNIVQ